MSRPRALLSRLALAPVLGLALVAGCTSTTTAPEPSVPPQPAPPSAVEPPGPPTVAGLAVWRATADAATTTERLEGALGEAGMVVATVDHAANAASVGQALPPTTLVIGGNPRAGTPIMAAAPAAAVDLPAKFLVWEDGRGSTWLGYNTAAYVGLRAGLQPGDPSLQTLATAQEQLARTASGSETPAVPGDGLDPVVAAGGYLETVPSARPVAEVMARYQQAFAQAGLTPVATVDHAAGAARIGAQLPPTAVTIAGNPEAGTPLIQAAQTIAIDLPTRFVAYADPGGAGSTVGYPDVFSLAERHGIVGQEQAVGGIAQAQQRLTTEAAG